MSPSPATGPTCADPSLRYVGICRLSNGNFLTDVVTCVKGNCDNQLDSNLFITPLQLACNLAGAPISTAAIRNAENAVTSGGYNAQTTTVVVGQTATTTANAGFQSVSIMTVTAAPETRTMTSIQTTTDSQGSTFYILVPITVQQGSTDYGQQSTATVTSSVTTTTVIAGAAPSSSSTSSSLSSAAAAENAGSTLSTSTSTTTVTPASTTQTTTTTTTTGASNAAANSPAPSTNGSPFGMQSVGTRKDGSSWLGLTVGLIAGVVWF